MKTRHPGISESSSRITSIDAGVASSTLRRYRTLPNAEGMTFDSLGWSESSNEPPGRTKRKRWQSREATAFATSGPRIRSIVLLFAERMPSLRDSGTSFCNGHQGFRSKTRFTPGYQMPSLCDCGSSRSAVTVIEVLFAMFVVLFGLVALMNLLPLAGRQAGDSYSMTHGVAAMQNVVSEFVSAELHKPTKQRPWWFANDIGTTPNGPFVSSGSNPAYASFEDYLSLQSLVQQRRFEELTMVPNTIRTEIARREGMAYGYCIDPLFCADQFREGWRYTLPYDHLRGSNNNQGVFRRSRMPFFDELTVLGPSSTGSGFDFVCPNPAPSMRILYDLPKLIRVSYVQNVTASGLPINLQRNAAEGLVRSLADILQAVPDEDKSFGPLRGFSGNFGGFVSNGASSRISWLATLTPHEETAPGALVPSNFNLSFVVFSNRDRNFDAAPMAVTNSDKLAVGERMCFATARGSNSPALNNCSDLVFSEQGGSFEMRLWTDQAADPRVRVGDWVMLSRRIVYGNNFPTAPVSPPSLYKVVHRHRWYRIIGVESQENWDNGQVIRVAGEPWDYPEIFYSNPSSRALIAPTSTASTSNPLVSRDLMSRVENLQNIATTATIFSDVVTVYQSVVTN